MVATARSPWLLLGLDPAGAAVFALDEAEMAVQGRLDLLGVIVIAFVSALGGGILRDLLIGAVPPAAIRDWRYPAVAFAAGMAVFGWRGAAALGPAGCRGVKGSDKPAGLGTGPLGPLPPRHGRPSRAAARLARRTRDRRQGG